MAKIVACDAAPAVSITTMSWASCSSVTSATILVSFSSWRTVIGLLAAVETQSVSVWLKSASSAAALRPESAERPRIKRASVVLPAPPFVVAMVMMIERR
jgi:hypothetical protein